MRGLLISTQIFDGAREPANYGNRNIVNNFASKEGARVRACVYA